MTPTLNITVDVAPLETLSDTLLAALAAGLLRGGQYAAGNVQAETAAAGVHSRTGQLLGAISAWPGTQDDDPTVHVGVPDDSPAARYAYLIGAEDVEIVPRGHKYLAIPIGANLTGAGKARLASPRDLAEPVWRGRTVGVLQGDRYVPYFALVERVVVFGRDTLVPGVEGALNEVRASIETALAEAAA